MGEGEKGYWVAAAGNKAHLRFVFGAKKKKSTEHEWEHDDGSCSRYSGKGGRTHGAELYRQKCCTCTKLHREVTCAAPESTFSVQGSARTGRKRFELILVAFSKTYSGK